MSKYADIEQIKKTIREEWVKYIPMEFDMNISFVLGKIAEVPTIEIVRCKDCKYSEVYLIDSNEEPQRWCKVGLAKAVDDDDYCSWGE